ncbi:mitochondrial ribosomal protein S26 [Lycorma delicatula]|uniref:mitochondrial ribosomal protein S26 n=1 Tax=Lycorma delicatula TaxID=130591 RepID=UPI003F50DC88
MNSLLRSQGIYSVTSKMLLPSLFTPTSSVNQVCLQFVRWRRKPRWLPVAKTKMYRVPRRQRLPEGEEEEVYRLFNNYRTSLKAIRYYLSEQIKSQTTAPEVIAEQLRVEQEDHAKCLKLNDEWNEEVKKMREKRVADEAEERRLKILQEIETIKQQEAEELHYIDTLVRSEKEYSKKYITRKNIDEVLEKVLSETIDYNFCIDLDGNIYRGIRARPGVTDPENKKDDSTEKKAVN